MSLISRASILVGVLSLAGCQMALTKSFASDDMKVKVAAESLGRQQQTPVGEDESTKPVSPKALAASYRVAVKTSEPVAAKESKLVDKASLATSDELSKVKLYLRTYEPVGPAPDGKGILCNLSCKVVSYSQFEFSSVETTFTLLTGNDVIYSKPVTFSSFDDQLSGYSQTNLPYGECWIRTQIEIPADKVESSDGYWFEMKSGHVFRNPTDLHNPGHWFSYILTHLVQEVIAKVRNDPSLAKVDDPRSGASAILYACFEGNPDVFRAFVEAGADPKSKAKNGLTTFDFAAERSGPIVQILMKSFPVDSETSNGYTPLMYAAKFGNGETVNLLGSAGADVNHRSSDGETPVLLAAKSNSTALVNLLQFQPKLDVVDQEGLSPIHLAAVSDDPGSIHLLVTRGMDINSAPSSTGYTPLDAAAKNHANDTLKELLKEGADPNQLTVNNHTALDLAVHYNNKEGYEILLPVTKRPLSLY